MSETQQPDGTRDLTSELKRHYRQERVYYSSGGKHAFRNRGIYILNTIQLQKHGYNKKYK